MKPKAQNIDNKIVIVCVLLLENVYFDTKFRNFRRIHTKGSHVYLLQDMWVSYGAITKPFWESWRKLNSLARVRRPYPVTLFGVHFFSDVICSDLYGVNRLLRI